MQATPAPPEPAPLTVIVDRGDMHGLALAFDRLGLVLASMINDTPEPGYVTVTIRMDTVVS